MFTRRKTLAQSVFHVGFTVPTGVPWETLPYILAHRHSEATAIELRKDHATSPACCRNRPYGSGFSGRPKAATGGSSELTAGSRVKQVGPGNARHNQMPSRPEEAIVGSVEGEA